MHRALLLSLISSATLLAAGPQPRSFRRPLVFEPNRGQASAQVKWIGHGPGYQVFISSQGITMMVQESSGEPAKNDINPASNLIHRLQTPDSRPKYSAVRMKLEGSRPWDNFTGLEPTGGVSNYFIGNDESAWRTHIPHYGKLSAAGVYDGVDLVFYTNGSDLEYDFVVKPGADSKQIRLAFEGQEQIRVDDKSGDLILMTAGGAEVRQVRPKVFQDVGNRRVEVAGGYEVLDRSHAIFALANYDTQRSLVIDPTIVFAKGFSGNNEFEVGAVTVDSAGNAYVAGSTDATNLPVNDNSLQWTQGPPDAYLLELSPKGDLLYSTYLGGNGVEGATGIAIDSTGSVYMAGTTASTNFPHQNSKRKTDSDVFVTRFFPNFEGIAYTAIVGGSAQDYAFGMALDPKTQAVYVTGETASADFPLINDHNFWHQSKFNGGGGDAFVFELDASGNLFRSDLMGGGKEDAGISIAVDHVGEIWISGSTCSFDFPVLPNLQQFPDSASCTGFVALWDTSFYFLRFSKFWGEGFGIAVDNNNEAYVAGIPTPSFATTQGALLQSVAPGAGAGFVTKFAFNGSVLNSTYIASSSGSTKVWSIALNAAGDVYVSGSPGSTPFPGAPDLPWNPELAFFSRLTPDLSTIRYSKFATGPVNKIALLDSSPVLPRQIYIAGNVNGPEISGDATKEAVVVTGLSEDPDPVSPLLRLRNFWKPDQAINIESGVADSSPIQPGWWSAEWMLVLQPTTNGDPVGQNVFWIQNRWKPDEYLNIESGGIQSTPIQPGWLSARWTFEQVPGTNLYRIHNVWQPLEYVNIESGILMAGPIQPGWLSAMWTLEPVI